MTTALERLATLIPPPRRPQTQPEWNRVERTLHVALPDDYKSLVEVYGPGAIDGFLWILQPVDDNDFLDLLAQRTVRREALRELRRHGEAIPHAIDSGNEAILPWAITENGDVVYWVTDPRDQPYDWHIVVNEARGPLWERFEGSATEFLEAVVARSFVPTSFPSDFPSDRPTFVPLGQESP